MRFSVVWLNNLLVIAGVMVGGLIGTLVMVWSFVVRFVFVVVGNLMVGCFVVRCLVVRRLVMVGQVVPIGV